MEIQIQDLVNSIKKDGIDEANKQAESIISNAKNKAKEIVDNANKEADLIKEKALKEIEVYKQNARISAEQAKRDAMLVFKSEIQKQFEKILLNDANKALDEKVLAKLISAVLNGDDSSKYVAEISSISDGLKKQLAEEIKNGLEIRINKTIKTGFKLSAKDGSGYFDCTDDEITNMLMPFFRDMLI